jgi:mono/diheme cytochrome c family protein
MASFAVAVATLAPRTATPAADETSVTFYKDVAPILRKNCESCHRPGQGAPMSLSTYDSARKWARSIRQKVVSRQMPPWFADPRFGTFANDRSLRQADIDTLVKWVDSGAHAGDPKDAPPPAEWPSDGWQIQPDVVIDGPEYQVPPSGVVEWTYLTVPSGFKEDTWVTSMEIRPSDPSVTHHVCLFLKPHSADVKFNVPVQPEKKRDASGSELPRTGFDMARRPVFGTLFDTCWTPGVQPEDYRLHGGAKLIPAGTDLIFQYHFTPNGKPAVERSRIGFTVAKEKPARRYITYFHEPSETDGKGWAIPPNAPNWESPPVVLTVATDVELVRMMPHMHLRGKEMTYQLVFPGGRTETALSVPKYDFNWELEYVPTMPIHLPKGTRLIATAHYDNSAGNKLNPDPNRTVYYGDQTYEEMMVPLFGLLIDPALDPLRVVIPRDARTARYEARMGAAMEAAVGTTDVPLDGTESRIRASETTLGDLVADAGRAISGADVAIVNGGGIRGDRVIPPGPLTRQTLVEIHPFGNVFCQIAMPGSALLEALRHGTASLPSPASQFPQVSGVQFRVDLTAPLDQRVRDVRVNGQPLDPNKTYTVATFDYLLGGGDGYTMFGKQPIVTGPDAGELVVMALEKYLASDSRRGPAGEPRIVIQR